MATTELNVGYWIPAKSDTKHCSYHQPCPPLVGPWMCGYAACDKALVIMTHDQMFFDANCPPTWMHSVVKSLDSLGNASPVWNRHSCACLAPLELTLLAGIPGIHSFLITSCPCPPALPIKSQLLGNKQTVNNRPSIAPPPAAVWQQVCHSHCLPGLTEPHPLEQRKKCFFLHEPTEEKLQSVTAHLSMHICLFKTCNISQTENKESQA